MVGLFPAAFIICLGIWMLVFTISRYVSVASMTAAAALPIAVTMLYLTHKADWLALLVSILMAVLAIWRHRANIARLRIGTEPRFEKKDAKKATLKAKKR
jgi:glycerol-3-phosphate acyltransferase PlsY